jgi:hypothetical protein
MVALKVDWRVERPDDKDDNNGLYYGIYGFECSEEEFDPELGYGAYDINYVEWFKTEKQRDKEFKTLK